jgi:dolichol-phosphate mannosyltransferase
MPRTLVALATYNEIENVPALVDEILRVLPAADLLIVDDNSPDGTGQWCDAHAAKLARLTCLHRQGKQGLGSATLLAMRYAIDHGYDIVVTLDADWSHHPRYLPELVRATDLADVAIGSRYIAGGKIVGWPLYRRIVSRSINRLSRLLLRLPVHDSSGAFRAYRVAKLREADLTRIQSTGYSYLEEIVWLLSQVGGTFTEVPITFQERRAGCSKINMGEAAAKIGTLARLSMSGRKTDSSPGSSPGTGRGNSK